jgi:hypothetical protein
MNYAEKEFYAMLEIDEENYLIARNTCFSVWEYWRDNNCNKQEAFDAVTIQFGVPSPYRLRWREGMIKWWGNEWKCILLQEEE